MKENSKSNRQLLETHRVENLENKKEQQLHVS